MAIGDALAAWQQGGTRIALTTTYNGAATSDYVLRDEVEAVWPHPNKALIRRNLETGGGPQALSKNFVLGRSRPTCTLRLPLTPISLAFVMQSLLQDVNYSSTKYVLGPYASPVTSKWFYLESGIAGAGTVNKAYGGRVVKATIDIPVVTDEDPGNPMIVAECVFSTGVRADTFTSIGSPTYDTAEPYTGKDLIVAIGGSAASTIISGSLSIDVGAKKSREITDTPKQVYSDRIMISGNLRCYSTTTTDAHATFLTAHDAKTDLELKVTLGTGNFISFDALLEAPSEEVEEGMRVRSFGFQNVDDDDSQPVVEVTTDNMSW